jgi:hypothetical protein
MELREFVTETLVQIQEGVQHAIDRRRDTENAHGVINPIFGQQVSEAHCQKVELDVAITVADKSQGSAKAGLRVLSVELGAGGSKAAERSTVSHVRFTVPIIPPTTTVTTDFDRSLPLPSGVLG